MLSVLLAVPALAVGAASLWDVHLLRMSGLAYVAGGRCRCALAVVRLRSRCILLHHHVHLFNPTIPSPMQWLFIMRSTEIPPPIANAITSMKLSFTPFSKFRVSPPPQPSRAQSESHRVVVMSDWSLDLSLTILSVFSWCCGSCKGGSVFVMLLDAFRGRRCELGPSRQGRLGPSSHLLLRLHVATTLTLLPNINVHHHRRRCIHRTLTSANAPNQQSLERLSTVVAILTCARGSGLCGGAAQDTKLASNFVLRLSVPGGAAPTRQQSLGWDLKVGDIYNDPMTGQKDAGTSALYPFLCSWLLSRRCRNFSYPLLSYQRTTQDHPGWIAHGVLGGTVRYATAQA